MRPRSWAWSEQSSTDDWIVKVDACVIRVRVRTIGLLGQSEIELVLPQHSTVASALTLMADERGERTAALLVGTQNASVYHPELRVLVNGRDLAVAGRSEVFLQDGDDMLMFTPVAGG